MVILIWSLQCNPQKSVQLPCTNDTEVGSSVLVKNVMETVEEPVPVVSTSYLVMNLCQQHSSPASQSYHQP